MPQSIPSTILIVNEHAEEIKLVTISLRGFFPDCRIDSAYSAEEAMTMSAAPDRPWALFILDDDSIPQDSASFVELLKRQSPSTVIILQTTRTDSTSATKALQAGVDYYLYKHSPAFLTELLFCTKEALARSDGRAAAGREDTPYLELIESFGDVAYQLDAEGHIASISRNLREFLGYEPAELLGQFYHILFPESSQQAARCRFNERRTGTRATTGYELTFQRREGEGQEIRLVSGSISARGIYDASRRFLGTVGIIRDLSERKRRESVIQELQQQLERTRALHGLAQQITTLSRELQQPLSTLLAESQQLFSVLREARVLERVETLAKGAVAASKFGERLDLLARESEKTEESFTVNRLIEELLSSIPTDQLAPESVTTDFAPFLPAYRGDRVQAADLVHHLLNYAKSYLTAVDRNRTLSIKTRVVGPLASPEWPTLFPLASLNQIDIEIVESDREPSAPSPSPTSAESIDLLDLYRKTKELGATLDISAPATGPLHLRLRLPSGPQMPSEPTPLSESPSPAIAPPEEILRPIPPETVARHGEFVGQDRRAADRTTTTLQSRVTLGASTWDGMLMNIGLGGVCIRLSREFPAIPTQEAYIVVKAGVGILELSGLAYKRTAPDRTPTEGPLFSHLIIAFHAMKQTERAVLGSLIEAVRDHAITLSIEVLLETVEKVPRATDLALTGQRIDQDRRETLRVALSLPARLEIEPYREPASRLAAHVLNISRSGASLQVRMGQEAIREPVVIHFPPPSQSRDHSPHTPDAPHTTLHGRIIWSAKDPTAPNALRLPGASFAMRIGVRFDPLTPHAERELHRTVYQYLATQVASEALTASVSVLTVPRECRNARGQTIAITDNHPSPPVESALPIVVITPGYGQTASDYTALAHYLAAHRLRVLRYDHTNHLGNSEGELQHTTLRSMQHDLTKVIEFVRQTWPGMPLVVIANDLGARTALKAFAQNRPLDLLLLINLSTDVEAMLLAVHGHNLVADYRFGLRRGIANLLGLNINADLFVGDLIAGRYTDLASTIEDLRSNRSPLGIITGPTPNGSSLPPSDLPHAFVTALSSQTRLMNIPTTLTDNNLTSFEPHPAAFKQVLHQISAALGITPTLPYGEASIRQDLTRQRRIERESTYLKHGGTQVGRDALASIHLSQVPQLGNLHRYRKALEDICASVTPINPGGRVVDSTFGESDLVRTVIVNHLYRARQAGWAITTPPIVIGVRRSRETIIRARHAVQSLRREISAGFADRKTTVSPLTVAWVQADWEGALPFQTGGLHRFISNLSLPYVRSPLATLREWHRVLHPEGRLIVTTFHPDTDLSILYRDHLRQANQDEFSVDAQPLLSFFGRLREAIRQRTIHTFERDELSTLIEQAGLTAYDVLPVLDGQALMAVAGKRNSSSPNT